jgi:hypothetical protein
METQSIIHKLNNDLTIQVFFFLSVVGLGNINNFKNKYSDPYILLYDLYN